MPFDGRETTDPTIALARFREAPNLRDLAIILRNRKVWPEGFRWDYSDCATCAMGMAFGVAGTKGELWADSPDAVSRASGLVSWTLRTFGLEPDVHDYIFTYLHFSIGVRNPKLITPEDVARAIERHLAATT
jgi:hypothetical protein